MRTKVISILTVVVFYLSVYFWVWANVPLLEEEGTVTQELAVVIALWLSLSGVAFLLFFTVKWLLNK